MTQAWTNSSLKLHCFQDPASWHFEFITKNLLTESVAIKWKMGSFFSVVQSQNDKIRLHIVYRWIKVFERHTYSLV